MTENQISDSELARRRKAMDSQLARAIEESPFHSTPNAIDVAVLFAEFLPLAEEMDGFLSDLDDGEWHDDVATTTIWVRPRSTTPDADAHARELDAIFSPLERAWYGEN